MDEKYFYIFAVAIVLILTVGGVTCSYREFEHRERMGEKGLQQCWLASRGVYWSKECR